ncbi:MAG: thioesterase family protein [Eubacteriales bacterium]|nr:thioesterase family protein [Eubacteriales bacterium]
MMETGIRGKKTITVTKAMTAKAMGSGELEVYATPSMIALMENTAYQSVAGYLEEGQGTVGTLMNVKHLAASCVGAEVTCETELTEVDRRRLVFNVKVSDGRGLIGEGRHERFIVDNRKFMEKAGK